MQQWWLHYQNQGSLPKLTDDEKKDVEDLTGCIPLLLRAILGYSGKNFKDVESEFLSNKELSDATEQLKSFEESMSLKLRRNDSLSWDA
jgi:hypothetical protein